MKLIRKWKTLIDAKLAEVVELKVVTEVKDKVKDMKENVEEKIEVERRNNNLIMHGLKESDDDLERVTAILNDGLELDAERHIEEVTSCKLLELTDLTR